MSSSLQEMPVTLLLDDPQTQSQSIVTLPIRSEDITTGSATQIRSVQSLLAHITDFVAAATSSSCVSVTPLGGAPSIAIGIPRADTPDVDDVSHSLASTMDSIGSGSFAGDNQPVETCHWVRFAAGARAPLRTLMFLHGCEASLPAADAESKQEVLRVTATNGRSVAMIRRCDLDCFVEQLRVAAATETQRPSSPTAAVVAIRVVIEKTIAHFGSFSDVESGVRSNSVPFPWRRGNRVGAGSFGEVWCCINMDSGVLFALKEIPFLDMVYLQRERRQRLKALRREVQLLSRLRHPNIVSYWGCEYAPEESVFRVFMEYVSSGSVSDALRSFGPLSHNVVRRYMVQLLAGLECLHDNGIVHRDLCSKNLFLSDKGVIRIGDFGSAKSLDSSADKEHSYITGTVLWMCPTYVREEVYTPQSDLWSAACCCLEMLTAQPPWPQQFDNPISAIFFIANTSAPPPIPPGLPDDILRFLHTAFSLNPADRTTARALAKLFSG